MRAGSVGKELGSVENAGLLGQGRLRACTWRCWWAHTFQMSHGRGLLLTHAYPAVVSFFRTLAANGGLAPCSIGLVLLELIV